MKFWIYILFFIVITTTVFAQSDSMHIDSKNTGDKVKATPEYNNLSYMLPIGFESASKKITNKWGSYLSYVPPWFTLYGGDIYNMMPACWTKNFNAILQCSSLFKDKKTGSTISVFLFFTRENLDSTLKVLKLKRECKTCRNDDSVAYDRMVGCVFNLTGELMYMEEHIYVFTKFYGNILGFEIEKRRDWSLNNLQLKELAKDIEAAFTVPLRK